MKKVYEGFTIKQISDELNLSRSTVSKVLNGIPGVSEKNKKAVLDYIDALKNTPSVPEIPSAQSKAIMFSYRSDHVEYINGLLSGIERTIKANNYLFVLNIITRNEPPYFPESIKNSNICGIISFNIYDPEYIKEIESLSIPSVFFDMPYAQQAEPPASDIVFTENYHSIHQAMLYLFQKGCRKFGFIGYPYYCHSLHQRWTTFQSVLEELELPLDEKSCFLDNYDAYPESEIPQMLKKRIADMKELPDAYICSSDKQAIYLYIVLKELGYSIPQDVAVVGFDNLPESLRQIPQLTTIDAHSCLQGELAVKLILDRLADPGRPPLIVQCRTKLLLRDSTNI